MEGVYKTIHDFPIEILQIIFRYGSPYDLLSFRLVCRRWNQGVGSLLDIHEKIILKINGKKINDSMLSSEWRTQFQGIRLKHLGRFEKPQQILTFPPNILSPLKRLEFLCSMSNHRNLFQIISGCPDLQHLNINCPTQHREMRVETEPGNYGPILSRLQSVSLTAGTRHEIDEESPLVAIHSILPKFAEHCKSLKSFELDITRLRQDYVTHPDFKDHEIRIPEAIKSIVLNNGGTLTHVDVKFTNFQDLFEVSERLRELADIIVNLKIFNLSIKKDFEYLDLDFYGDWTTWDTSTFIENYTLFIERQKQLRKVRFPFIQNDTELSALEKFYETLETLLHLSDLTLDAFWEVNLNYLHLCGPLLKVLTVNFHANGTHSFTPFIGGEVEAAIQTKIQGMEIRLKVVLDLRTEGVLISNLQLFGTSLSHLSIEGGSITNHLLQQVVRNCPELKCLKVFNACDVTDFGVTGIAGSFLESTEVRTNGLVRNYDVESGRTLGGLSLTNLGNLEILHLEYALKLTDIGIRYGLQFSKLKRIKMDGAHQISDHGLMILAFQNPNITHATIDTSDDVMPGVYMEGRRSRSIGLSRFGIDTFLRLLPNMVHQNAHIKGVGTPNVRGPSMYDAEVEGPVYIARPSLAMAMTIDQSSSSDSDN